MSWPQPRRRSLGSALALGAALLATWTPTARAIGLRQARSLAQAHAEQDLSEAEVVSYRTSSTRVLGFAVGSLDGGERHEYRVDLGTGQFVGWLHTTKRGPDMDHRGLTDATAIARASEAAGRVLGPDAGDLEWTVLVPGARVATVRGASPPSGNPPRSGLGPRVTAVVRSDGAVTSYRQYVPHPSERNPLPVALTDQDAVRIAREDAAPGRLAEVPLGASLEQSNGEVTWRVGLACPAWMPDAGDGPESYLWWVIDARSGRILERQVRAGMSGGQIPTGFAAKASHNASVRFWNTRWPGRPVGAAVAAALALVLTIRVWRAVRQRPRRSPPLPEAAEPASWFSGS